jgi:hypothetical protein
VAAVAEQHPGATLHEAGGGSIDKAFDDIIAENLGRSEIYSLPITLAILMLAFGALVAASVPLLLGIASVAAAMGQAPAVTAQLLVRAAAARGEALEILRPCRARPHAPTPAPARVAAPR